MIIGGSKKKVVANIKNAADNGRLNDKVEIGDPELDNTRRKKLLGKYVKQRNEIPYHYRNWLARRIVDFMSGAAYGVNGKVRRVSEGIFVAAPKNIDITGDTMKEHVKNGMDWNFM